MATKVLIATAITTTTGMTFMVLRALLPPNGSRATGSRT